MSDSRRSSPLTDFLAAHPAIDWVPIVGASAAWGLFGPSVPAADRVEFLVGVATLSGLVLAASTFVCALTYQSTAPTVAVVRRKFGPELRRNWTSVFGIALAAAVVSLTALLFHRESGALASFIGVGSLTAVVVKGIRAHFWLGYTLFMHRAADTVGEPYVVALPNDQKQSA